MPGLRALVGTALATTHLFVDFDGTLAPIVDDAASARALPGVAAALDRLVDDGCRVTVVSGRPAQFLADHVGAESVELVGLYGLERVRGGAVVTDPSADRWAEVIDDVADRAVDELPDGVVVEHKGLSLTIHHRTAPGLGADVDDWAKGAADAAGLEARGAKRSVEVHPPVGVDKGVVVRRAVDPETTWVVFVGDDRGDLPAFDALDDLAAAGIDVLRIAVRSDEVPEELAVRADLLLDGPAEVLAFLSS